MSGLISVNGREGEEPMRVAQPITDLLAGLYCAFGIVSVLMARDLNGRGQHVETAMMMSAVSMMPLSCDGIAGDRKETGADRKRPSSGRTLQRYHPEAVSRCSGSRNTHG